MATTMNQIKCAMLEVRTLEISMEIDAIKLRQVKYPNCDNLKHICFIAEKKLERLSKELISLKCKSYDNA